MRYQKVRYLTINGKRYRVEDIGVDDPAKARANRHRIKNQAYTRWWRQMEASRDHVAQGQSMPSRVPVGELPQAGGKGRTRDALLD